jgi:hypothetical protein
MDMDMETEMQSEMQSEIQTQITLSPEKRAQYYSLFESMFGPRPNSPQRCRRNIRELYTTFTKDISELLENLLVLMKKYEFSLFAHEKLLQLCQHFNSIMNENETDPLIIGLNQLSTTEKNLVDDFKIGLSEWMDCFIYHNDTTIINLNKDEFSFLF